MTHIFHNRLITVTIINDVKFITHFHNNFTHKRIFHNAAIFHQLQVYFNHVENLVEKFEIRAGGGHLAITFNF